MTKKEFLINLFVNPRNPMNKRTSLEQNIPKLYLFQILRGAMFSVPVMVLFWQDNGLNLTQIMVLQSVFAILMVILEVPTGYFADLYGRKISLSISTITLIMGISIYSIGSCFMHFLIAEIILGVSNAFSSGTTSALLYDTLKNLNRENEYKKLWGKTTSCGLITLAITGIVGGFISQIDLRYTLILSIPFFILMIPVVLSTVEPERYKRIIKKGYVKEILKLVKTILVENRKLKWIIIYSGIIFAFGQSALWLYQPYFELSGLNVIYFGVVFASFHIVSALSSNYAHRIENKLGNKYSLLMMIFLIATSYLLMSSFVFLFSFTFCFIQQFVRGFKSIVITDYINNLVGSDIRATILSIESLVCKLLYAMVIPIIGYIADVYSVVESLWVLGITTLVIGVFILLFFRKLKVL